PLKGIRLVPPPVRGRLEDVPLLAEVFLKRFGERQGRALRLSAGAIECLFRYAWPGNVRELENAMERTAILARSETIEPGDLPPHVGAGVVPGPAPALEAEQTLAEAERTHIIRTLERCGGNHSRAAEALGIGRTTLWRKLKDYGIEK